MNGTRRNLLEKNTGCTEETSRDAPPCIGGALILCCWVAKGVDGNKDVEEGMGNEAQVAESTDCMPICYDKNINGVTREELVVVCCC